MFANKALAMYRLIIVISSRFQSQRRHHRDRAMSCRRWSAARWPSSPPPPAWDPWAPGLRSALAGRRPSLLARCGRGSERTGRGKRTDGAERRLGLKTVEGSNRKNARRLTGFMDLNDTVSVIMDVISRFKSSWTGMAHPYKFKDRVCTLL